MAGQLYQKGPTKEELRKCLVVDFVLICVCLFVCVFADWFTFSLRQLWLKILVRISV